MEWIDEFRGHLEAGFFFILPAALLLTLLLSRYLRFDAPGRIRLRILVILAVTMLLWRIGIDKATSRYILPAAMLFCLPAAFGIPWLIHWFCSKLHMNPAGRRRVKGLLLGAACTGIIVSACLKTAPWRHEAKPIRELGMALHASCAPGAVILDLSGEGTRIARWLSDDVRLIKLDKTFAEYGSMTRLWECMAEYTTIESQDVWIITKQAGQREDILLKGEMEGLTPIFPFRECGRFPYRKQAYLLLRFDGQTEWEIPGEMRRATAREAVLASRMEAGIRKLDLSELLPADGSVLLAWKNAPAGKLQMVGTQLIFVPRGSFSGSIKAANPLLWPVQQYDVTGEEKADAPHHYVVRLTPSSAGRRGALANGRWPLWWPDKLLLRHEGDPLYEWSADPLAAAHPAWPLETTRHGTTLKLSLPSENGRFRGETESAVAVLPGELPEKLKAGRFLLCSDPEYRPLGPYLEAELRKRGSGIGIDEIPLTAKGASQLPENLPAELEGPLAAQAYDGLILNIGASELQKFGMRWSGGEAAGKAALQMQTALRGLCRRYPRMMLALVMPPAPAPGETDKDPGRQTEWYRLGMAHQMLCRNWWPLQDPALAVIAVHPYLSREDYERGLAARYRRPFALDDSGAEHMARAIVNGLVAASLPKQ